MRFLQAEIDLKALVHNLDQIKKIVHARKPNCKIIAIVKADAYGHGAVEVAKTLEKENVRYFGVAFFEEAVCLREAGITSKIIVLFDREIKGVFKYNLIPVVFDYEYARDLSKEAVKRNVIIPVHIKVETGMGRLGIYENIYDTIKNISTLPNLKIEGIMSHLSMAENKEWTQEQIARLKGIKDWFSNSRISPMFHISNSGGIAYPEALFDGVRPGIMLYGYNSAKIADLKPVMTVKTKLLDIRRLPKGTPISYGRKFVTQRDSLIGVIPVGYADGYFRVLSNKAHVLVSGKRVPVVGTVCMDLTMIDITECEEPKIDDEVIILGKSGNESITADEIALWANTISYEVLTSLGGKAKRKYIGGQNDSRQSKES